MVIERSRRDFLKQASLLAAASGTILRTAQGADVVVETAFGKVRGVDADHIKMPARCWSASGSGPNGRGVCA